LLTTEKLELVAFHLWRLVNLLGLPRDRHWPGIERTPLWPLLAKYAQAENVPDAPDDPRELSPLVRQIVTTALAQSASDLSDAERGALVALLAQQLQWNPANRPTAAALLLRSPDFQTLTERFRTDTITPMGAKAWTLELAATGWLKESLRQHVTASIDAMPAFKFPF
jgi:hypothetical protein